MRRPQPQSPFLRGAPAENAPVCGGAGRILNVDHAAASAVAVLVSGPAAEKNRLPMLLLDGKAAPDAAQTEVRLAIPT